LLILTMHNRKRLGRRLATFKCGVIVIRAKTTNYYKRNYMVHYLLWRVLTKQTRQNIKLNFMIAGHTKFAPDQPFGNIKRRVAITFVSSL